MDASIAQLPPSDPRLVDAIVGQLKSEGIFDRLRKECLADVDTKPAFQNLKQRVDAQVQTFLSTKAWQTDMNKNQLRESVRKNVQEAGILETGIDAIVNQVVNPKVRQLILPCVEDTVFSYLNIPRPNNNANENSQYRAVMNLKDDTTLSNDATESNQQSKVGFNLPVEADAISSEEDEALLEPSNEEVKPPSDVAKEDDNAVDCFGDLEQEGGEALSLAKLSLKGTLEKCEPTSSTDSESKTGPAPTLFEHQSLDSISSNSSGLSFSPAGNPPKATESPNQQKAQPSPLEAVTSTSSPVGNSATSSPFSNVSQTSMPPSVDQCSSSNSQPYDSHDSKEQSDATNKVSSSTSKSHDKSSSSHRSKHHKDSRHRSRSKHDDHYSHKKSHSKSRRHHKDDDSDADRRSHSKSSHTSHKSSSSHKSHRHDDRKSSHRHTSSEHKSKSSSSHRSSSDGGKKSPSSTSSHKHKSSHKDKSSHSSSRKHKDEDKKKEPNNNKTDSSPKKDSPPPKPETKTSPSAGTKEIASPPAKRTKSEKKSSPVNGAYKREITNVKSVPVNGKKIKVASSVKTAEDTTVPVNGTRLKERLVLCSFQPEPSSGDQTMADDSDFGGFADTNTDYHVALDDLVTSCSSSDEMGFEGFPEEPPRRKISVRNRLKRYLNDYITVNLDMDMAVED